MSNRTILPPKDPSAGFWAGCARHGYNVRAVWAMASEAVAATFGLTPAQTRDLLDSDAGTLLAEDIGFIDEGPTGAAAIEALLDARLAHLGWRRLYDRAISEVRRQHRTVP